MFTFKQLERLELQYFVLYNRWMMQNGEKVMKGGKPMIEFVAVQRQDNQQWALPGVGDTNTFFF